jgi:glycerophosphoryl diester phosphodiesterase
MLKLRWLIIVAANLLLLACSSSNKIASPLKGNAFELEGHRGARGLLPENTIPSMRAAIDHGATMIELDVVISKDRKVVVSHDHIFHPQITTDPQGKYLTRKEAEKLPLYGMTYEEIRKFDVGLKPHAEFPQQQKIKAYKPLLEELIDSVEMYAKSKGKRISYNVEIKSGEEGDGIKHPDVATFSELIMAVLQNKNVLDRLIIQSFDVRPLRHIHKNYPSIKLALLVGKSDNTLEEQINRLGFQPTTYSPVHPTVTKELVQQCHQRGMKIIPWTVNELAQMQKLVDMGVDGIISDYPNLFAQLRFTTK